MAEKFYITTTLPYVNADPHIGFALELVLADVIVRYQKLLGKEVFFNTGTDEHGMKIYNKAVEQGKDPQAYSDEYAAKFRQLIPALGISDDIHFIRTTDEHHIKACQEFWKLCSQNGYIEKKLYKIKYCVGCELEKTESELVDGRCPLHPNLELEIREEENYFFKFSAFQDKLLKFYQDNPDFVVPDFRFNEIKQFVKAGLQDFSISRLKSKLPWGVEVPGDPEHVMYVWFDALINYISTLGWPCTSHFVPVQGVAPSSPGKEKMPEGQMRSKDCLYDNFWITDGHSNAVQIAGKDNLRQQSAMWQAMLMAAGLPNSRQIFIHGFINSGGQKMSKSLGNVADPYQILDGLRSKGLNDEQAIDALRYYLIREIPTFEDGDYTWEHLVESYNANLANGLGNLTSRILKMATSNGISPISPISPYQSNQLLEKYELQKAANEVWQKIKACDEYIQKTEPFKVIKTDKDKAIKDIQYLLSELQQIACDLRPLLPQTSEMMLTALNEPKLESIPRLFPRIE